MKVKELNQKYFNADLDCFAYYTYYHMGCIHIVKPIMQPECGFDMHLWFVFMRDTLTKMCIRRHTKDEDKIHAFYCLVSIYCTFLFHPVSNSALAVACKEEVRRIRSAAMCGNVAANVLTAHTMLSFHTEKSNVKYRETTIDYRHMFATRNLP